MFSTLLPETRSRQRALMYIFNGAELPWLLHDTRTQLGRRSMPPRTSSSSFVIRTHSSEGISLLTEYLRKGFTALEKSKGPSEKYRMMRTNQYQYHTVDEVSRKSANFVEDRRRVVPFELSRTQENEELDSKKLLQGTTSLTGRYGKQHSLLRKCPGILCSGERRPIETLARPRIVSRVYDNHHAIQE